MPLAVFDIDGTLTDTTAVDVECYDAAVRSTLEVVIPDDWEDLEEITDAAILASACALGGREVPDRADQHRVAERVAELLEAALARDRARFRPIPGAGEVFAELAHAGWQVAMATGAWRPSALVKLRGAGIPFAGIPLVTATEHARRVDIVRHAVAAAGTADTRVVCFGDGVWDLRTARALGHGFVGVGRGARAAALASAGAEVVLPDFTDVAALLAHLERMV